MSKKRILPLIVFFLLVAGIDQLLGWVISDWAKKHKYDQRMELLLRGDIRSEMVILGSSRALNNYSPHTITQITGKSCYNLGFSGSNIEFHETILDLLMMQEEKPKVILLNLDDCATLYPVNGIEYRKDVLLPWINHPFVNQKVCEQLNKAEWATRISGTYRHNVNFIKALKYLI